LKLEFGKQRQIDPLAVFRGITAAASLKPESNATAVHLSGRLPGITAAAPGALRNHVGGEKVRREGAGLGSALTSHRELPSGDSAGENCLPAITQENVRSAAFRRAMRWEIAGLRRW
jgi:hypothetical protein